MVDIGIAQGLQTSVAGVLKPKLLLQGSIIDSHSNNIIDFISPKDSETKAPDEANLNPLEQLEIADDDIYEGFFQIKAKHDHYGFPTDAEVYLYEVEGIGSDGYFDPARKKFLLKLDPSQREFFSSQAGGVFFGKLRTIGPGRGNAEEVELIHFESIADEFKNLPDEMKYLNGPLLTIEGKVLRYIDETVDGEDTKASRPYILIETPTGQHVSIAALKDTFYLAESPGFPAASHSRIIPGMSVRLTALVSLVADDIQIPPALHGADYSLELVAQTAVLTGSDDDQHKIFRSNAMRGEEILAAFKQDIEDENFNSAREHFSSLDFTDKELMTEASVLWATVPMHEKPVTFFLQKENAQTLSNALGKGLTGMTAGEFIEHILDNSSNPENYFGGQEWVEFFSDLNISAYDKTFRQLQILHRNIDKLNQLAVNPPESNMDIRVQKCVDMILASTEVLKNPELVDENVLVVGFQAAASILNLLPPSSPEMTPGQSGSFAKLHRSLANLGEFVQACHKDTENPLNMRVAPETLKDLIRIYKEKFEGDPLKNQDVLKNWTNVLVLTDLTRRTMI